MIETLSRFDAAQGPRIVGPKDGRLVDIGAIGARFILWGEESGVVSRRCARSTDFASRLLRR